LPADPEPSAPQAAPTAADDSADDSTEQGALDEPQHSNQQNKARARSGLLRWLRTVFYFVWGGVIPFLIAALLVTALKAESLDRESVVRGFVRDQKIPTGIVFFAVSAIVLYRFRYALPLAGWVGVLPRRDLPSKLRGRFDDGAQLIEEANRILTRRRTEVRRALKKGERDAIRRALDKLDAEMTADKLSEDRFTAALSKAEQLVDNHLARWRKGEAREYTESIAVAVAVALILRVFVIEAFKIPSGSMIPTLMVGDHIFVAKYAYGPLLPWSDSRLYENMPPARGDVMVFKFPENKKQDFIKRVVALPGDKLEALDGRPVLNDWLVPHCYVGALELPPNARSHHVYLEHLGEQSYLTLYEDKPNAGRAGCKRDRDCGGARSCRAGLCGMLQGPYQVKEREAWVMGDNRNNSHDSRSWRGGLGGGVPLENIKGRAMFVWMSWHPSDDVAWDRLFVPVMGRPELPRGASADLMLGLQKCERERPPVSQTTPPAPRSAPAKNK